METIKRNPTSIAISNSLFKLLKTQNFDAISVNDICQEALISRTTFYVYFEDKYQLVLFLFNEERNQLGITKGIDIENNMILLMTRMRDNEGVCRNLLTSGANRDLNQMITLHFNQAVIRYLEANNRAKDALSLETLASFYTGGIVYTITQWLEGGAHGEVEGVAKIIMAQIH